MFCPHCNNKIPDGSNICPLCYANLAGVKQQVHREERPAAEGEKQERPSAGRPRASSRKPAAYTKGSRGSKKSADRTPMIIAFGLIVILIIIIAMIVRSMFSAGTPGVANSPVPQQEATTAPNFIVFGASTGTPEAAQISTPTPAIEITPSPTPQQAATYTTLRKGDQGPEVVALQMALAELGYLTGAQDGNFGTGTQNAVKAFQKAKGLDDDGIAGKLTLEALYAESSVTPIPEVTAGPDDILDLPG